jgi:hypothetical protein
VVLLSVLATVCVLVWGYEAFYGGVYRLWACGVGMGTTLLRRCAQWAYPFIWRPVKKTRGRFRLGRVLLNGGRSSW